MERFHSVTLKIDKIQTKAMKFEQFSENGQIERFNRKKQKWNDFIQLH
ncbi:hypothetical protein T06_4662 [Trichinella sp. T6]|nr:hypothetical protein T06_4662 [Trichinella sp. T6]